MCTFGKRMKGSYSFMDRKLFKDGIKKFLVGLIIISLLLFIPAGTINYWNGWLFICLLFIPMFIAGIILMKKNPEKKKKRLSAKEEKKEQKVVILLSGIMFLLGFITAGLNFRFSWIALPNIVIIISSILFLSIFDRNSL